MAVLDSTVVNLKNENVSNEDKASKDEGKEEEFEDNEDDEEECRVCRGPAEEGRPLYAPCCCSGSIGRVHQDCLKSWLNVTRGDKCELCSYVFKFAPKYHENAPDRLPVRQVVKAIIKRFGCKWFPFLLRLMLVAIVWLGALPLMTAYLYFAWLHRPSSLQARWKMDLLVDDVVSGAVVATVIIVSFLSLLSFADFLRIHWRQINRVNNEEENEDEENENVVDQHRVRDDEEEEDRGGEEEVGEVERRERRRVRRVDGEAGGGGGDDVEMEIHLAVDVLLGIRGPITALLRNILWLLVFNTTFLGLFCFVPHKVGLSVKSSLPSFEIEAIKLLCEASSAKETLLHLEDVTTIVLGYLSMALLVFLWQFVAALVFKIIKIVLKKSHKTVILEYAGAIVKVGVLLFFKMLLFPMLLGIWLDVSTLKLFDTSLEDRLLFAGSDLFSSILYHWVAGITFMLLTTVSVLQLREVFHPDLLSKVVRPQEPQLDLLGNLLKENGITHLKRMFLSLGIYSFMLFVHVCLPSWLLVQSGVGAYLPFFRPRLFFMVPSKLQTPIELLVFHLGVLAFLEKYKNQIGHMQHCFMVHVCKKIQITEFILPCMVEKFVFVGKIKKEDALFLQNSYDEKEILQKIQLSTDSPQYEKTYIKRGGQRVLPSSSSQIFLDNDTFLNSTIGSFRLQLKDNDILFYREVHGRPIPRPPDGWDDLGAGGAELQGRWAWGTEKPSNVEKGIARRRPCNFQLNIIIKLAILAIVSWLAVFIFIEAALNTPLFIGRCFFYSLQLHQVHDTLCSIIGLALIFFSLQTFSFSTSFSQWIQSYTPPPSKNKLYVFFLAVFLWIIITPAILGIFYYTFFIMTHTQWAHVSSTLTFHTFVRAWLSGVLILHIWAILSYFAVFTKHFWHALFFNLDNDQNVPNLTWQGKHGNIANFFYIVKRILFNWEWDKIDSQILLNRFILSIIYQISICLLGSILFSTLYHIPYDYQETVPIIGFIDYGRLRMFTFRIFALIVINFRLCIAFRSPLKEWFHVAHKVAKDDLYLIGEELLDYEPKR